MPKDYSDHFLSKYGYQVMAVFFNTDESLTFSDIEEIIADHTWAEKTLHYILNDLERKGYIKVDGERGTGRRKSRTYKRKVTIEQYNSMRVLESYSKAGREINLKKFISSLVTMRSKEVQKSLNEEFLDDKDTK